MHKLLTTPIVVDGPYGPVSCTHEAFGLEALTEWSNADGKARLIRTIGVLVGTDFKVVPSPDHEEVKLIDVHSSEFDTIYAEIQRILALP